MGKKKGKSKEDIAHKEEGRGERGLQTKKVTIPIQRDGKKTAKQVHGFRLAEEGTAHHFKNIINRKKRNYIKYQFEGDRTRRKK